jgi:hypothetical protein
MSPEALAALQQQQEHADRCGLQLLGKRGFTLRLLHDTHLGARMHAASWHVFGLLC